MLNNDSNEVLLVDIKSVQGQALAANTVMLPVDRNRVFISFCAVFTDDFSAGNTSALTIRALIDGVPTDIAVLTSGNPNAYLSIFTHGRIVQEQIQVGASSGIAGPTSMSWNSGRLTTEALL